MYAISTNANATRAYHVTLYKSSFLWDYWVSTETLVSTVVKWVHMRTNSNRHTHTLALLVTDSNTVIDRSQDKICAQCTTYLLQLLCSRFRVWAEYKHSLAVEFLFMCRIATTLLVTCSCCQLSRSQQTKITNCSNTWTCTSRYSVPYAL